MTTASLNTHIVEKWAKGRGEWIRITVAMPLPAAERYVAECQTMLGRRCGQLRIVERCGQLRIVERQR